MREMAVCRPGTCTDPAELRGHVQPWGLAGALALAALVAFGLWLRLRGLAAEGFADDEVHKWLGANRYLAGQFGGDDVEHPMIMKGLVALTVAALRGALAPEALTRLPNAIAGSLTILTTALLGRRLFGRGCGLLAAAFLAASTTAVGYHRIAKEDVLLGLFWTISLWGLTEARAAAEDGRARDQGRWELLGAAAVGAAFASKYFLFYFPIPVLAYLWLRPVSAWRVPLGRWFGLIGVAALVFFLLNWAPLLPGSASYMIGYVRGERLGGDRSTSESLLFMGRLYGNMAFARDGPPAWFYLGFAALKFAPATALLGTVGLAIALARRAPAHRVVLCWVGFWYACMFVAGGKYGRFFISVMPGFLLLSAHGATELARWARARFAPTLARPTARGLAAAGALLLVAPEASAAVAHAPHYRLYVNALGGGDRNVNWFLPHCDYFDAGVREALAWVAAHAEPGAEVASEVDWTVRLYSSWHGRPDLASTPIRPGSCRREAPCYVLVQPGRLYQHNQAAVQALAARAPAHVESIRGADAVRVYRLAPGEALFPPTVSDDGGAPRPRAPKSLP